MQSLVRWWETLGDRQRVSQRLLVHAIVGLRLEGRSSLALFCACCLRSVFVISDQRRRTLVELESDVDSVVACPSCAVVW